MCHSGTLIDKPSFKGIVSFLLAHWGGRFTDSVLEIYFYYLLNLIEGFNRRVKNIYMCVYFDHDLGKYGIW